MTINNALFEPINIGNIQLSGRFVKSATVETLCDQAGFVTAQYIQHYEELAQGGTPLIITGAASYNTFSRGVPYQLAVDHDDKIEGLKKLADTVHQYGSKIMVQIYHTARQAAPAPMGRSKAQAPSVVSEPILGVKPDAMSIEEIHESIQQYADAAERCKIAGMDGVQIHAAHGYLLSSFLTPHTNRRRDSYGGSFENRLRLLLEIYHEVRKRVGSDFPVIMKINGSDDLPYRKGLSTETLVKIAKRMEQEGIDAVEVTAGHYESGFTFERGNFKGYTRNVLKHGMGVHFSKMKRSFMWLFAPVVDLYFQRSARFSAGFNIPYARQFTKALNVPVICVGGLNTKQQMSEALANNDCDMVSAARGLVADPYLYHHMKNNLKGPECNYCNACFSRPGVNPLDCYDPHIKAEKVQMLAREQPELVELAEEAL
ncbi:MAG: NADH:flavin oxidoreductase [Cellvibrionaceae bacterium]|nr:NADH:flavin oxidoreductase [Cellvibrionaceae bacterium]|tara:strand:+ start:5541 stop:6827 length:1287 start_codon:yes stop_codon:yes gene_type:complete